MTYESIPKLNRWGPITEASSWADVAAYQDEIYAALGRRGGAQAGAHGAGDEEKPSDAGQQD